MGFDPSSYAGAAGGHFHDTRAGVIVSTSCLGRSDQIQIIQMLVEKARTGLQVELRQGRRFPFFQPVTLSTDDDRLVSLPAFARDISPLGVGLLSNWPVNFQPVHLRIHMTDEQEVELSGFVRWCQPCGQGWYTIGVGFQDEDSDGLSCPIGGFTG